MIGKLSPQQIVMNLLKDNANPIFGNLIDMAQKGDTGSVDTIPNVADPTGAGIATQAPTILNANFAILESKNNAR